MELKKRIDFRKYLIAIYVFCFLIYLIIGLSPVSALNYEIAAEIFIPKINLSSNVTSLKLKNHELETPDTIVGSFSKAKNKMLLIGHSTSVFKDLGRLSVGDKIIYNLEGYEIIKSEVISKNEIKMNELLKSEEKKTLVLMTCAGEDLGGGDATERLIITAVETDFKIGMQYNKLLLN